VGAKGRRWDGHVEGREDRDAGIVPSSFVGIWMSVISPKGMNALWRRSYVVSDGRDDTWIVHFARAVAVAAILDLRNCVCSQAQEQRQPSESNENPTSSHKRDGRLGLERNGIPGLVP